MLCTGLNIDQLFEFVVGGSVWHAKLKEPVKYGIKLMAKKNSLLRILVSYEAKTATSWHNQQVSLKWCILISEKITKSKEKTQKMVLNFGYLLIV